MRILLVEADPTVAQRLAEGLGREGLAVRRVAATAEAAPVDDEVVLVGLPDGDRLAYCRALRAREPTRRIVVLTPEGGEPQAVAALEAGADDTLARAGVSVRELAARLRAVGRRRGGAAPASPGIVATGGVRIDPEVGRVEVDGEPIQLAPTAWGVLLALADSPGRVVARETLVLRVWGDRPVDPRTLDSVVKRLRARLGAAGRRIETVRGVGYRLRT